MNNIHRDQYTRKNFGIQLGSPSDVNFGRPHQILVAHLFVYFS